MSRPNFRLGRKTGKTISWFAHSLDASNACCIYCGTFLQGVNPPNSDKEHLVAKNFVPKGSMDGQPFNFLFRACRSCNARKAHAERHVSSVSLFNSPGRLENNKVNVNEIAMRKGKGDFHPKKQGVPVKDAHEHITVGPANMTFGMVAPPQIDRALLEEVAFSHIQGLFALICTEDYRDSQKMRLLPQNHFICYQHYTCEDWGNPQAIEITNRVSDWVCLANIETAEGYFKAIMRRGEEGWFWALEWNKYIRVMGAIGVPPMKLFERLPSEDWTPIPQGRMRQNVPLDTNDDHLFVGAVCDY